MSKQLRYTESHLTMDYNYNLFKNVFLRLILLTNVVRTFIEKHTNNQEIIILYAHHVCDSVEPTNRKTTQKRETK